MPAGKGASPLPPPSAVDAAQAAAPGDAACGPARVGLCGGRPTAAVAVGRLVKLAIFRGGVGGLKAELRVRRCAREVQRGVGLVEVARVVVNVAVEQERLAGVCLIGMCGSALATARELSAPLRRHRHRAPGAARAPPAGHRDAGCLRGGPHPAQPRRRRGPDAMSPAARRFDVRASRLPRRGRNANGPGLGMRQPAADLDARW